MIKARIVPINQIVSQITSNIKKEIDNTPEVSVETNIGKATGISVLSNIGPKFNIKMETARSEFKLRLIQNLEIVELIRLYIEFI